MSSYSEKFDASTLTREIEFYLYWCAIEFPWMGGVYVTIHTEQWAYWMLFFFCLLFKRHTWHDIVMSILWRETENKRQKRPSYYGIRIYVYVCVYDVQCTYITLQLYYIAIWQMYFIVFSKWKFRLFHIFCFLSFYLNYFLVNSTHRMRISNCTTNFHAKFPLHSEFRIFFSKKNVNLKGLKMLKF